MIVFGFASRRSRPGAAVAVAVVSTLDGSGSLWSNYFGAVKIDIAFVANIHTDPEAARFLRALLALGSDLDLVVIAEGVELPEQAQVLGSLGCEFVQGFLYAHPAPAGEFDQLLASAPLRHSIAVDGVTPVEILPRRRRTRARPA